MNARRRAAAGGLPSATSAQDEEDMSEPAYVSKVRIERLGGPQRLAYLPAEDQPIAFGVHAEVAEHYGVAPDAFPPRATTLDYVVAAAGG
jgi:hypothetical protein